MKALSLHQPWASLLVGGEKQVETRSWEIKFRGRLLIHAAKKWTPELRSTLRSAKFREAWERMGKRLPNPGEYSSLAIPLGVVVGSVEVVDCFSTSGYIREGGITQAFKGIDGNLYVNHQERAFGDYSLSRYAFLCKKPKAFDKPVPYPGRQGFFDVPDDLVPEEFR